MRSSNGDVGALQGLEGQGADHVGGARQALGLGQGQAARPRSSAWVPLMRARPSLASRTTGREAGRSQGLGAGRGVGLRTRHSPSPDQREGEVGERGEVPLAPDRPLRGDQRDGRRGSAWPPAAPGSRAARRRSPWPARWRAAASGARVSASPRGSPTPGGVAPHQVELQLADAVQGDDDVGEVAEAGGHAVDDRPPGYRVVDDAAGGEDRRTGRGREADGSAWRPPTRGRRG